MVPAIGTLTVHYDPEVTSLALLVEALTPLVETVEARGTDGDTAPPHGRRWWLPACYDPEFGPDIEGVARQTGLRTWQVSALHACVSYQVRMLGFLSGQPYLGELPPPLQLPRRAAVPRR